MLGPEKHTLCCSAQLEQEYNTWPEGIHSDFSGGFGVLAMFAVVWGVALTAWTVVAYLAARIFGKSRAA
jgi:hypothetical protein